MSDSSSSYQNTEDINRLDSELIDNSNASPSKQSSQNPSLKEPLLPKPKTQKSASIVSKKTDKSQTVSSTKAERQLKGRIQKLSTKSHPLDKTSCLGAFFYSWVSPFLWVGKRVPFEQNMHAPAPKRDMVSRSEKRIIDLYKSTGSISKSIIAMYKGTIIKNFILMALCQGCLNSVAVFMYLIISDAAVTVDNEERTKKMIIYFGALIVGQVLGAFLKNYIYCDLSRLSVRLKCGVIFTIYKKLLRISVLNPSEHTESNVINYMNVDA